MYIRLRAKRESESEREREAMEMMEKKGTGIGDVSRLDQLPVQCPSRSQDD